MEERRGADASRGYRRVLGRATRRGAVRRAGKRNVGPGAGGHMSSRMYIALSLDRVYTLYSSYSTSSK